MKFHLLLFACLTLLMSTTCKKDYYDGAELVLLKATLNNPNEVLRLGDTLKVTLTVPATLTSETGVVTPINSVQEVLYNFRLYQIDTLTNRGTRIVTSSALMVSKGTLNPNMSSVYTTTSLPPFQSILNIVPLTKGFYSLELNKGGLTVNNGDYKAFLRMNFDVPNKHWNLYDRYVPGFSTDSAIIRLDVEGNGFYYFMVR